MFILSLRYCEHLQREFVKAIEVKGLIMTKKDKTFEEKPNATKAKSNLRGTKQRDYCPDVLQQNILSWLRLSHRVQFKHIME